jgi:ketosteroid isomerase-like protein
MRQLILVLAACLAIIGRAASADQSPAAVALQKQVADTERAFAATMAKRDFAGFASFISSEAIFFSGPKPLHGKEEVAAWWKKYYEKPGAPFSWEPDQVEVLPSGTLAMTSGPVYDPDGKLFARFTSVWRLEAPDTWRIVFDKGNDVCSCDNQ